MGNERWLRAKDAARHLGKGRSTFLADVKRGLHPQGERREGRRVVTWDRLELDAWRAREAAEPRAGDIQDRVAALCSNTSSRTVMVPVLAGSFEAKNAALREALDAGLNVNVACNLPATDELPPTQL